MPYKRGNPSILDIPLIHIEIELTPRTSNQVAGFLALKPPGYLPAFK